MRFLLMICALAALAACQKPAGSPAANQQATTEPAGPVKGVDRSHRGKAAPDAMFNNPDGEETSLAEFRGKPLLVNLWASWCAPCVKELPTLDRLATSNAAVRVLAVSQDMGPHASVVAFLDQHKIADLEAFQDPKMALSGGLGVEVMPTTLLYDAQGREVWRYVGELDWTSGEAARLLAEAGPGGATRH
jgi:thiol-disulfide isomerase/thioredoxin